MFLGSQMVSTAHSMIWPSWLNLQGAGWTFLNSHRIEIMKDHFFEMKRVYPKSQNVGYIYICIYISKCGILMDMVKVQCGNTLFPQADIIGGFGSHSDGTWGWSWDTSTNSKCESEIVAELETGTLATFDITWPCLNHRFEPNNAICFTYDTIFCHLSPPILRNSMGMMAIGERGWWKISSRFPRALGTSQSRSGISPSIKWLGGFN